MDNEIESYDTLLPGQAMNFTLKYPSRDAVNRYIINDDIEVISVHQVCTLLRTAETLLMGKKASNGVVLIIDGTSLY